MTEEKRRALLLENYKKILKANKEGYAGCLPNGNLVDRREHPEAYPIAENSMFHITKPRCVCCNRQSTVEELKESLCKVCQGLPLQDLEPL